MRNASLAALILVLPLAAEDKPEWTKAEPGAPYKAEILFPAKPEKIANKTRTTLKVGGKDGKPLYQLVAYSKSTIRNLDKKRTRDILLAQFRDEVAFDHKGKVVADKDIMVGGFFAKEYDIETPIGLLRGRVVLTPGKLYRAAVYGPKEIGKAPETTKFLESLKVND